MTKTRRCEPIIACKRRRDLAAFKKQIAGNERYFHTKRNQRIAAIVNGKQLAPSLPDDSAFIR